VIALFIATSIPSSSVPLPSVVGSDKTAHLIAYCGLGVLLALSIRAEGAGRGRGAILALAIACTYAMLDEWHQQWIPTRGASLGDVVADWVGAILGVAAVTKLGYTKEQSERDTADPADE
jgi:VanZ family protein